jgi:hypothetical protein
MMREKLGAKIFQQALISKGLQIICKVLREFLLLARGGGVPEKRGAGFCGLGTRDVGTWDYANTDHESCSPDCLHCAPGEKNVLQRTNPFWQAQGGLSRWRPSTEPEAGAHSHCFSPRR